MTVQEKRGIAGRAPEKEVQQRRRACSTRRGGVRDVWVLERGREKRKRKMKRR